MAKINLKIKVIERWRFRFPVETYLLICWYVFSVNSFVSQIYPEWIGHYMIPHGTAKLVGLITDSNYLGTYIRVPKFEQVSTISTTPRISTFISNKNYFHLPQRKLINLNLVFIILYKLYTKIRPEGVADNKYIYISLLCLQKKKTGLKQ